MPDLEAIEEAADAQYIEDLATFLSQFGSELNPADCQAIAYVLVKTIGTLLWLSLSQEPDFRQRLFTETKRLALAYLQSYLP